MRLFTFYFLFFLLQCGFFKRNRPQYPTEAAQEYNSTQANRYNLVPSNQSDRIALQGDSEEISSDDNEDNPMNIENPVDSLPIIVPQHSSHFIQQRTQFPY